MKRFCHSLSLVFCATSFAQMPSGWQTTRPLEPPTEIDGLWLGGGAWAAGKGGPPASFVQSLGLANSLTGNGISLSGGYRSGSVEMTSKVILFKDASGKAKGELLQGHLSYRTKGGWYWGLEQEPLVWGYGLNGGYVLGEAARPVPKFRVETPFRPLSFFNVPLGTWKAEFFLGQMESTRVLGENVQDPSYRIRSLATDPQRPYISGFRTEARFGTNMEFYLNWLNLFGGTLQGRSVTEGYNLADWLTAMVGVKDALAEGNNTPDDPWTPEYYQYKNKARSASTSDVGVRISLENLASLLGAKDARFYVTRGSKAVNIHFGAALKRPLFTLGKDLNRDWRAIKNFDLGNIWRQKYRYYAPSPEVPNDVFGILVSWDQFRLGLEYLGTTNRRSQKMDQPSPNGHRSFVNSLYPTGFYFHGDPLGTALGGEARVITVRAEIEFSPSWSLQGWVHLGDRPYLDVTNDWLEDHPGQVPNTNKFIGIQEIATYRRSKHMTLRCGTSYQHQTAVANQKGVNGNGFRWFLELEWQFAL